MQWFQVKEKSAGKKRLILTYYIYKVFGKYALYLIAFFVSVFTFCFSSEVRSYSKKYFEIISKFINIKPSLINQFRQIFSYSLTLADKIIMYMGDFSPENMVFDNEEEKEQLFNDIRNKKGVCFIFTHVGNIEVMQSFFNRQKEFPNIQVNAFLNKSQTKIFNDFLDIIKKPTPINYIITEDFDISSVIKLKENLDKGGIVFIAGDRLSESNADKTIEKTMFSHKVKLPKGTFQLAKILETPVYFISAIKTKGNKYKILLKKNNSSDIPDNYIKYTEEVIKNNPFRFYHFYDFFN